jgi:hypothetical protein
MTYFKQKINLKKKIQIKTYKKYRPNIIKYLKKKYLKKKLYNPSLSFFKYKNKQSNFKLKTLNLNVFNYLTIRLLKKKKFNKKYFKQLKKEPIHKVKMREKKKRAKKIKKKLRLLEKKEKKKKLEEKYFKNKTKKNYLKKNLKKNQSIKRIRYKKNNFVGIFKNNLNTDENLKNYKKKLRILKRIRYRENRRFRKRLYTLYTDLTKQGKIQGDLDFKNISLKNYKSVFAKLVANSQLDEAEKLQIKKKIHQMASRKKKKTTFDFDLNYVRAFFFQRNKNISLKKKLFTLNKKKKLLLKKKILLLKKKKKLKKKKFKFFKIIPAIIYRFKGKKNKKFFGGRFLRSKRIKKFKKTVFINKITDYILELAKNKIFHYKNYDLRYNELQEKKLFKNKIFRFDLKTRLSTINLILMKRQLLKKKYIKLKRKNLKLLVLTLKKKKNLKLKKYVNKQIRDYKIFLNFIKTKVLKLSFVKQFLINLKIKLLTGKKKFNRIKFFFILKKVKSLFNILEKKKKNLKEFVKKKLEYKKKLFKYFLFTKYLKKKKYFLKKNFLNKTFFNIYNKKFLNFLKLKSKNDIIFFPKIIYKKKIYINYKKRWKKKKKFFLLKKKKAKQNKTTKHLCFFNKKLFILKKTHNNKYNKILIKLKHIENFIKKKIFRRLMHKKQTKKLKMLLESLFIFKKYFILAYNPLSFEKIKNIYEIFEKKKKTNTYLAKNLKRNKKYLSSINFHILARLYKTFKKKQLRYRRFSKRVRVTKRKWYNYLMKKKKKKTFKTSCFTYNPISLDDENEDEDNQELFNDNDNDNENDYNNLRNEINNSIFNSEEKEDIVFDENTLSSSFKIEKLLFNIIEDILKKKKNVLSSNKLKNLFLIKYIKHINRFINYLKKIKNKFKKFKIKKKKLYKIIKLFIFLKKKKHLYLFIKKNKLSFLKSFLQYLIKLNYKLKKKLKKNRSRKVIFIKRFIFLKKNKKKKFKRKFFTFKNKWKNFIKRTLKIKNKNYNNSLLKKKYIYLKKTRWRIKKKIIKNNLIKKKYKLIKIKKLNFYFIKKILKKEKKKKKLITPDSLLNCFFFYKKRQAKKFLKNFKIKKVKLLKKKIKNLNRRTKLFKKIYTKHKKKKKIFFKNKQLLLFNKLNFLKNTKKKTKINPLYSKLLKEIFFNNLLLLKKKKNFKKFNLLKKKKIFFLKYLKKNYIKTNLGFNTLCFLKNEVINLKNNLLENKTKKNFYKAQIKKNVQKIMLTLYKAQYKRKTFILRKYKRIYRYQRYLKKKK